MFAIVIAKCRSLAIRFDTCKKCIYVSVREYLSRMSNTISELDEMDHELTYEEEVLVVIYSVPNDTSHIKVILSLNKYIITFENIKGRLTLEEER